MIEDFRDGSGSFEHSADLCIIGAGPAGIAIANAFACTRHQICLIESGGLDCEVDAQDLLDGSSVGNPGLHPAHSRLRVYGGSCRLWGGGCIPLSPSDFEQRDWIPFSGWPIRHEELAPWYLRAQDLCRLPGHSFSGGSYSGRRKPPSLGFDARQVVDRVFAHSPVDFGRTFLPAFARAPNIRLLLHANLLELHAVSGADHIGEASIGALNGRRGSVRARHYVLASGGIENARLLLLSDSVVPGGLGNDRDLVGRYFQDHPRCRLGTMAQGHLDGLVRTYGHVAPNAKAAYPEICLSEEAQRACRLLACRTRPYAVHAPPSDGVQALRELRACFSAPRIEADESTRVEREVAGVLDRGLPAPLPPPDRRAIHPARAALKAGRHANDVAAGILDRLRGRSHLRRDRVDMIGYFEQAPNPRSRVTLDDRRDALGQRRVRVDWQLTELDHTTHRTASRLFGEQLSRVCGGDFLPDPWLSRPDGAPDLHGSAHHIGTTRMSDDPRQGVVDRNCRVHGIDNLHVAGSSVFPTGGWAFPTLTIVALSLRLAEEIRVRLEGLAPPML